MIDRYMIATKAIHKLGDLSRDSDICRVTEEDDDNYYGMWLTGYGFFNVRFPKETTRDMTDEEFEKYSNTSVQLSNHESQRLRMNRDGTIPEYIAEERDLVKETHFEKALQKYLEDDKVCGYNTKECSPVSFKAGYDAAVGNLEKSAPALLECCLEFIRKVECGEAKSKRTYAQMKSAVEKMGNENG